MNKRGWTSLKKRPVLEGVFEPIFQNLKSKFKTHKTIVGKTGYIS